VMGLMYMQNSSRSYRQAAEQFSRVKALAPERLPSRVWLGQLHLLFNQPDDTLKLVQEIRARSDALGLNATNQTDVVALEASAYLVKKEVADAEKVFQTALAKAPGDEALLSTATQVYMRAGLYTNALATIEQRLQLNPTNVNALVNKGFTCLQLKDYDRAIEPLSRVIEMGTNETGQVQVQQMALLNRAIAYLLSDKLDAAQQDYETLQKALPTAPQIFYGLGEVAYRKKDTNAAVRNYELFLSNAPTNTPEYEQISQRVKEWGKNVTKEPTGL